MRRVVVRGGTNGARATPGGSTRFVVEQPKNFTQIIVKSGTRECQAVQQQYNKIQLNNDKQRHIQKHNKKNGNSQFWALFQSLFPFLTHTYTHMSSGGPRWQSRAEKRLRFAPRRVFYIVIIPNPNFVGREKLKFFESYKKSEKNGRF